MAEITSMLGESILQLFAAIAWAMGSVHALIAAGHLALTAAAMENIWLWAAVGWVAFRDPASGR